MADKKPQKSVPQASGVVMNFPQPPARKAEDYLNAYATYVFSAINAITTEVASIDLKLFQKKKTTLAGEVEVEEVHQHESLSFLQYVNPLMTFYDVIETTQAYLELIGEAFWVLLRDESTGQPFEIWPVRPDWIKIKPSPETVVESYIYHPGGTSLEKIEFPRENVIHFKYFNPKSPFRGKGAVQAGALPLDIWTFAMEYNRNLFFNSAIPGLVFTTDKNIKPSVLKRFIIEWQNTYGGRDKSHKAAFLTGGFKLQKTSLGAKELDFANQMRLLRDDILAVFQVPKSVLGVTEDVNRANAEASHRTFMERVVTPRMKKLTGTLNEFLLPMFDDSGSLFFDFVDPSPDDVELKLKVYANARGFGWMTPNEIRIQENLEPLEGGDDLTPAGSLTFPGSSTDPGDNEPGGTEKGLSRVLGMFGTKKGKTKQIRPSKPFKQPFKHMMPIPKKRLDELEREKFSSELAGDLSKLIKLTIESRNEQGIKKLSKKGTHDEMWTEEAKTHFWQEFIKRATQKEMAYRRIIIGLFEEQKIQVVENLNQVKHWRKALRKGKELSVLPELDLWNQMWIAMLIPFIREMVIEKANQILEFLGVKVQFNPTSSDSVKFLRVHGADLITGINTTTRNRLKKELAIGFEKGESVDQLRVRVNHVFKQATTARARMIARTEAIRASNFAAVEAYRQSEVVTGIQWLTERDNRVCAWCNHMEAKIIKVSGEVFFDKGDKLTVGGETIKFGAIEVGYPPLHPNCRCSTIPVLIGETSLRLSKIEEQKKKAKNKKKVGNEIVENAKEEAQLLILKAAEEATTLLESAKGDAKRIVKSKRQKGNLALKKAKKEAEGILIEAKGKAQSIELKGGDNAKEEADEVIKKAKLKAGKKMKDARVEAEGLVKDAQTKAKKERNKILGELLKLRDKVQGAIRGKKGIKKA